MTVSTSKDERRHPIESHCPSTSSWNNGERARATVIAHTRMRARSRWSFRSGWLWKAVICPRMTRSSSSYSSEASSHKPCQVYRLSTTRGSRSIICCVARVNRKMAEHDDNRRKRISRLVRCASRISRPEDILRREYYRVLWKNRSSIDRVERSVRLIEKKSTYSARQCGEESKATRLIDWWNLRRRDFQLTVYSSG